MTFKRFPITGFFKDVIFGYKNGIQRPHRFDSRILFVTNTIVNDSSGLCDVKTGVGFSHLFWIEPAKKKYVSGGAVDWLTF